ncbi:hypothetical protein J6590_095781 [Homalodisca vitripennis]|nr:hypothetical protein J6590_095781 [Homalodisca vitripennis]
MIVCLRRRQAPVPTPLETIPMPRRQICDRLPCEESDSHSESTKMKMNFINNSRDHIILERSCNMKTLVEK